MATSCKVCPACGADVGFYTSSQRAADYYVSKYFTNATTVACPNSLNVHIIQKSVTP